MRQRIQLTPRFRRYIIHQLGADPEALTLPYWYHYILTDPDTERRLQAQTAAGIQTYLRRRAQRRRQQYLRTLLGLPRPSGSTDRQRRYAQILRAHIQLSTKP